MPRDPNADITQKRLWLQEDALTWLVSHKAAYKAIPKQPKGPRTVWARARADDLLLHFGLKREDGSASDPLEGYFIASQPASEGNFRKVSIVPHVLLSIVTRL